MPTLASQPVIEVTEGDVHKALSVSPIRYDTFAKLNLRFDRRYDRAIQLTRSQLAEHIRHCTEVFNRLSQES